MADTLCNIVKGRVVELYNRVKSNDPTNSAFVWVALNVSGDQDDAIRDCDTLAAVEALANVAEVTNAGYSRKVVTDADLAALPAPDDTNNRFDIDIPDPVFANVSAGDAWTDLLLCYDSDTTAGTDSNIIPMCLFDFPMTPDGSSLQATVNAAGFFRAS
jgi:hypothetical protein